MHPTKKLLILIVLLTLILTSCGGNSTQSENKNKHFYYGENNDNGPNDSEDNTNHETDSTEPETTSLPELEEVTHWFYYLDVNLGEDTIVEIENSTYDLIVIDFITSEANNTDFPLAEVIERWHTSDHPKLVLAYIDIGQAESFRTYWQEDWEIGNPKWILGDDPDGWEENYPVAFWHDEFREIWLGEDGAIEALIEAGFDGIYLDWVEAYDDEMVNAAAEAEGVDPIQEMIWWVGDLADYGRERNPNFIVIGQNAAELAIYDEYVEAIDAIAQEQTWFDGGADDHPPGDCPLPQTEADVETEAYENSLSKACYDQYLEFPDSTLHVSSEWYLDQLLLAQSKGLVIFTVDYAVVEENINWIYETSRGFGFIPFASNRWLDQFVVPIP